MTLAGTKPEAANDSLRQVVTELAARVPAPSAAPAPSSALGPELGAVAGPSAATGAAPSAPPAPNAMVPVPLGQPGWGQAFGNQVVWAMNQGAPSAQLHLSPPELGPMSVRISMEQDQASLAFSSPHPVVREAIEAALPRLRDLLGSQGITLADVNVSPHAFAEQRQPQGSAGHAARAPDAEGLAEPLTATRLATGLVDAYA
jgi:flagellar hook-length control protein FliK